MAFIKEFKGHTLTKRKETSAKVLERYPDMVPVIVDTSDPQLSNLSGHNKLLISRDAKVSNLILKIREFMAGCRPEQTIFLFVNNTLPPMSENMGSLYKKYKEDDGFLYVIYSGENTFGL